MSTHIQSISFDPEGVEVIYAEEHEMYDNGLRIFRTAVIPRNLVIDLLADLEESAIALVDQISVIQRAPENTFKR